MRWLCHQAAETFDEPSFFISGSLFLDLACFAETQRASPELHRERTFSLACLPTTLIGLRKWALALGSAF